VVLHKKKIRKRFQYKFQDVTVQHRETVCGIVNKLRQGCYWTKFKLKCCVLTVEEVDEVSSRLEHSPWKSLRCLAQETIVSKSLVQCYVDVGNNTAE
jgi:hypothetical protein